MLVQHCSRLLSTAAPRAVGDFSALRVVSFPTGKALESSAAFAAGSILFRFTGSIRRNNIGDRSLSVGSEAHLTSLEPEQPWVFLNHSFSPSVRLSHGRVANADALPPVLTATAAVDLLPGAPLTINYTLHEWEMFGQGFLCAESGRTVRGFKHLTDQEKDAALPFAADHIKSLHLQHLFGSESRC